MQLMQQFDIIASAANCKTQLKLTAIQWPNLLLIFSLTLTLMTDFFYCSFDLKISISFLGHNLLLIAYKNDVLSQNCLQNDIKSNFRRSIYLASKAPFANQIELNSIQHDNIALKQ